MPNIMYATINGFKSMPPIRRKSVISTMVVMFLLLFTYSVVRSNCDSLLLSILGARAMPYAWIFSVLTLTLTVTIFDRLQIRVGIHKLYIVSTTLISVAMLTMCILIFSGVNSVIYPMYVLKEVYIVILLSSAMGYLNVNVPEELAKVTYGLVAALCSVGGITGGLFSSNYVRIIGMDWMLYIGAAVVFMVGPLFYTTDKTMSLKNHSKGNSMIGPVRSLSGVKGYAIAIAAMVMLSQFVIGLATQKMNINIADGIVDSISKAEFFGRVYATVSGCSIVLDLLFVPLLLKYLKVTTVHLLVPAFHLLLSIALSFASVSMVPYAVFFISLKALDYSIFSVGKEFLYFPLGMRQRYGIKYVADIFMGRFSKGIISVVLIYVANISTINFLIVACLLAWIAVVSIIAKMFPMRRREEWEIPY